MRKIITTEEYLSIIYLDYEEYAEKVAFGVLVDEFSVQMKNVFNEKIGMGKEGWDSPYRLHLIKDQLHRKVELIMNSMHTSEDLVDIANLAAMTYNMIAPSENGHDSTE